MSADDETVQVRRVSDGELVVNLTGHKGGVSSIAFSPDGRLLATASREIGRIWSVYNGELVSEMTSLGRIENIAFSPDGRFVSTSAVAWDNFVQIRRIYDGQLIGEWNADYGGITDFSFLPDGFVAIAAYDEYSDDEFIAIWRISDGKLVSKLDEGLSINFPPDGSFSAIILDPGLRSLPFVRIWGRPGLQTI